MYDFPGSSFPISTLSAALSTTFTSWSQRHFVAIGKAQAACAQSFIPWQQATMEIMLTCHDHAMKHAMITLLLLVRATCIWCFSLCTIHSWWTMYSAQCQPRGCNSVVGMQIWRKKAFTEKWCNLKTNIGCLCKIHPQLTLSQLAKLCSWLLDRRLSLNTWNKGCDESSS